VDVPLPVLMDAYLQAIATKATGTRDAYRRILRDLSTWLAAKPGGAAGFVPDQLTQTAVTIYLEQLQAAGYSRSHCARVKAVISGFARFLIEEHGALRRNPTRGITLPPASALAPRQLSGDQRFVLRSLIEREGTTRGAAIFALGYWAGCRVSDVAHLETAHLHVTPKLGWMTVGHKGGKQRTVDLHNEARRALYDYIHASDLASERRYVFPSQRSERLTEAGIHHWFRALKALATTAEWELIAPVTFHDLRHDFAHRARAAGWSLEEVAYYLGHLSKTGTPAIQTTVRYTQVSRDQVRPKLRQIQG
jgi:site-specific recombinase XerD